ncbi:Rieske 2Fe-2S family protein [Roseiarcus fermentans]|uniref:Rieske 2Fe-2S family protein n=1 Tax=Roseiarcus fermentans TaxID=1473586 RepID=A0A366FET1_9HYPH|nr:aromatic ring-hydroxylating dioxygenase subunit alpha [Roseiarcus fermentans]RBP13168.1 Rieske 2Fe-2S family protein [Roseiarcus fermentans]
MRAEQKLLTALKGHREGYTLPRELYVDPDIYRLDLETIYYADWLFVGHDCEIKGIGDYFTVQVGDYPIVVVRGEDGAIRAFHNSCRHRGSRICSSERGSAVRLVCPYHKWSYDLEGRLRFARDMGKPFDAGKLGLKPVACESVAGYVWVCLADEPPDFAAFRARMAPYFHPHGIENARLAFESTIVENGNWKLVWENNRECYHCAPNHPELCLTFPETPAVSGVEGGADRAEIAGHWERMEEAGLPSRLHLSSDGKYRLTRMPLLGDSYTMSGAAAVRRPLSASVVEHGIGTLLLFNYPTLWNHVLGDHAVTFRVLPIGPTQTAVTTKWLVNADAVEGVDYSLKELTEVWLATNDQDRRIVEENQIGVLSPAYEPGSYSPIHEGGVVQFVEWYVATVLRALGEAHGRPHVA